MELALIIILVVLVILVVLTTVLLVHSYETSIKNYKSICDEEYIKTIKLLGVCHNMAKKSDNNDLDGVKLILRKFMDINAIHKSVTYDTMVDEGIISQDFTRFP